MAIQLHQVTAALYLLSGLIAWLGFGLRSPRLERVSVGLLLAGAVAHLGAFGALHALDPTPSLTDLPTAISFTACVGSLFFLALMRRLRLAGLTMLVAPVAFVSVFLAAVHLPQAQPPEAGGAGPWPHLHVVLSSLGVALLGLSGLAGLLFLAVHRGIKAKRALEPLIPLPSLEALDRVNTMALAAGFPLLSIGVVTGMIWVQTTVGTLWSGTAHQTWTAVAWAVYAALVAIRFGAGQGARQAALSSVAGFAFLFFAVIGVGFFG